MRVDLNKNFSICLIPLKPQFCLLLHGKSPPKLASKKIDNFRQGVPPFDMKLKETLQQLGVICLYVTDDIYCTRRTIS